MENKIVKIVYERIKFLYENGMLTADAVRKAASEDLKLISPEQAEEIITLKQEDAGIEDN